MYSKEEDTDGHANFGWVILDPQGDYICAVANEFAADALLSHLNRE